MADPSMTVALTLIARQYSATYATPVSVEFASTNDQIKAIEDGSAADVLIAAKPSWIEHLQDGGLIDVYSKTNVAKNHLVLSSALSIDGPRMLRQRMTHDAFSRNGEAITVALGDPEFTAEGSYTLEALRHLGLASELEPSFTIFRDMRKLAEVTARDTGYGFLFASDAALAPQLHTLAEIPDESHSPILYQAVVIAGDNMEGGRSFSDYLTSDAAKAILAKAGFDVSL